MCSYKLKFTMESVERKRTILTPHTGLRGIAAFCVLMTHLGSETRITHGFDQLLLRPFYWSSYAVDLFFMLSGFILHWVYCRDSEEIRWKDFFLARCTRILPLYYLTMVPFLPPIIRTFQSHGLWASHGECITKFLANIFMISGFSGEDKWDMRYNAASWSVCVEMLAYLVLMPLLVYIFRRFRIKGMAWILSISAVGMLMCYGDFSHRIFDWDWAQFARGIFCFPMGFALCALFRSIPKSYDAHLGSALSISSVLVGLFAIYYLLPRQIMLCAFPFLILATAMNVGIICRILNTPVSQWLGERSYSIYLWHTPIMYVWFLPYMEKIDSQMPLSNLGVGIVNMAIIVLGTFLVAEISYRLFENPIRNLVAAHRLRVRMVGQP